MIRFIRITALLLLSGVGAELLTAYGDSTGDPGEIAFSLVFFAALYGAPALLVRDLARRAGWGWPSMFAAYTALGIAQACLIDQSMFADDYMGYEGWTQTRAATLIPALGISAYNAYNFVVGHVAFSFAAPVALAEAWSRDNVREAWLGPVGTTLAALAYIGAATLVVMDPQSRSASPTQLAVSGAAVAAMLGVAVLVGRARGRRTASPPDRPLPVWATFSVAFCIAGVTVLAAETWGGFAFGLGWTLLAGVGLVMAARRWAWSPSHSAAVALAWLMVRGLLAFTYFPLLGDVTAEAKYAHNVVMLCVVVVAGWFALRRSQPHAVPRPHP